MLKKVAVLVVVTLASVAVKAEDVVVVVGPLDNNEIYSYLDSFSKYSRSSSYQGSENDIKVEPLEEIDETHFGQIRKEFHLLMMEVQRFFGETDCAKSLENVKFLSEQEVVNLVRNHKSGDLYSWKRIIANAYLDSNEGSPSTILAFVQPVLDLLERGVKLGAVKKSGSRFLENDEEFKAPEGDGYSFLSSCKYTDRHVSEMFAESRIGPHELLWFLTDLLVSSSQDSSGEDESVESIQESLLVRNRREAFAQIIAREWLASALCGNPILDGFGWKLSDPGPEWAEPKDPEWRTDGIEPLGNGVMVSPELFETIPQDGILSNSEWDLLVGESEVPVSAAGQMQFAHSKATTNTDQAQLSGFSPGRRSWTYEHPSGNCTWRFAVAISAACLGSCTEQSRFDDGCTSFVKSVDGPAHSLSVYAPNREAEVHCWKGPYAIDKSVYGGVKIRYQLVSNLHSGNCPMPCLCSVVAGAIYRSTSRVHTSVMPVDLSRFDSGTGSFAVSRTVAAANGAVLFDEESNLRTGNQYLENISIDLPIPFNHKKGFALEEAELSWQNAIKKEAGALEDPVDVFRTKTIESCGGWASLASSGRVFATQSESGRARAQISTESAALYISVNTTQCSGGKASFYTLSGNSEVRSRSDLEALVIPALKDDNSIEDMF